MNAKPSKKIIIKNVCPKKSNIYIRVAGYKRIDLPFGGTFEFMSHLEFNPFSAAVASLRASKQIELVDAAKKEVKKEEAHTEDSKSEDTQVEEDSKSEDTQVEEDTKPTEKIKKSSKK